MRKTLLVRPNDTKTLEAKDLKSYNKIEVKKDASLFIDMSFEPVTFTKCDLKVNRGAKITIRPLEYLLKQQKIDEHNEKQRHLDATGSFKYKTQPRQHPTKHHRKEKIDEPKKVDEPKSENKPKKVVTESKRVHIKSKRPVADGFKVIKEL